MTELETEAAAECAHEGTRAGAKFCPRCGTRLGDDPDPEPTPIVQRRPPLSRKAKRRRLVAAAVAVVLAAALGVLYVIQDRWYSPEEPIRELFAILESGDAAALAKLRGANSVAGQPLFAAGALDAGWEPPTDFRIESVEHDVSGHWEDGIIGKKYFEDHHQRPNKEYAYAVVSYALGGERHETGLAVRREATGFFRQWRIDPEFQFWEDGLDSTVEVSAWNTETGTYRIAGAETDSTEPLLAMPGVYEVTIPGDAVYEDTTTTVAVPIGQDVTVSGDQRIKDDVYAAVTEQVHAHVDTCIATPGFPDGDCGFKDDSGWLLTMPSGTEWQLGSYPTIDIATGAADDSDLGSIVVVTTEPGLATAEWEKSTDGTRTIQAPIVINGYAAAEGDGIVFHPRACPPGQSICR